MFKVLLVDDEFPRDEWLNVLVVRLNEKLWKMYFEEPIIREKSYRVALGILAKIPYPLVLGRNPSGGVEYLGNNRIDILVCDHNLWWNENPNGGYEFRYGYQFVQLLKHYGLHIPTTIIFSDDYYAPSHWEEAQVPYESFVPKYGEAGENLLRAIVDVIDKYKILPSIIT